MAGCTTTSEPEYDRVVSTLMNAPIGAPDSVKVLTGFTATIATYFGGCNSPDGATIRVTGAFADVTLYDLAQIHGACAGVDGVTLRTAELSFATTGLATIRIHSRTPDGDVLHEKTVVVVP